MKKFALAACLGVIAMGMNALAAAPQVGEKAPDFKLEGTDGKTYELQQFKGKKAVVIAWFPKAKTGGCTKECKSFKEAGKELKGLEVAYFTASCDVPSYNKEFAQELDLDYPILSDPTKKVAKAYGVVHEGREVPERWTFIIDKEGVIRHIDKEVQGKVATHGADTAKKLKELGLDKS